MEWDDSIKDPDADKKRLEALIAQKPEDAEAHYKLGAVYEYMRDYPKAVECCKKAISLDDENELYHAFLVFLYGTREYDEGKTLEAAADFAELGPDEGEYYTEKAMDSLKCVHHEPGYEFVKKLREQGRNIAAKNLERWLWNP